MSLYSDSKYPVREDLDATHAKQLAQLAAPGTWGNSQQRLAIAAEARQAGYDAGILEKPDDAGAPPEIDLPDVAKKVVRELAANPKDFLEANFDDARAGGLSDAEYTEIVGIVSRVTDLDVFARGIGVPLRPLPAPGPGEPSRERPDAAIQELAFMPTVPNPPEGPPKPYIMRGLSLVPDEMKLHIELEQAQYLPAGKIMDPVFEHHKGFTRAQGEIVAGRVSALNECFY
ncbi:MAG: hypothetical protein ACI9JL_004453 [Paracoccaceae bacterium]|jgi:hypothetical protein